MHTLPERKMEKKNTGLRMQRYAETDVQNAQNSQVPSSLLPSQLPSRPSVHHLLQLLSLQLLIKVLWSPE